MGVLSMGFHCETLMAILIQIFEVYKIILLSAYFFGSKRDEWVKRVFSNHGHATGVISSKY
jgi:uncharacterized protein YqhQ